MASHHFVLPKSVFRDFTTNNKGRCDLYYQYSTTTCLPLVATCAGLIFVKSCRLTDDGIRFVVKHTFMSLWGCFCDWIESSYSLLVFSVPTTKQEQWDNRPKTIGQNVYFSDSCWWYKDCNRFWFLFCFRKIIYSFFFFIIIKSFTKQLPNSSNLHLFVLKRYEMEEEWWRSISSFHHCILVYMRYG